MADNYFGLTDIGMVRGNNEDTFILQPAKGGEYIIACAIDGVGGYSGGEVAAALAKDSIIEYLQNLRSDVSVMMTEALITANEKICYQKIEVKEHDSMACVLTMAVVNVKNNEFHYIHVGDTRLYLLRDGSLVKLTKDQSFVGFLEDSGRLTEDEAMRHPKRNEINKALGFNRELEKDVNYFESGTSPFLPGDLILLCSDGLTDMVNKQDITDILTSNISLEEMAEKLISSANSNGGKDNITAVLVKNDKPFQKQEAVKPSPVSKKKEILNTEDSISEKTNTGNVVLQAAGPIHRSNRTAVMLLSILSIGLLLSTIYLLWLRGQERASGNQTVIADTTSTVSETSFSKLISTFPGDTLILSDSVYIEPILFSAPINISSDTLYILSRGKIVFKGNSTYTGPAFLIPATAKSIVLNGMTFDGFDIGISSQSKNVRMEGVKFLNTRAPLQYQFTTPADSFFNGTVAEMFFRNDSLSVQTGN
ncbi:PP2C family protein-serine/threonine phosphatase [Daejeonella sp.]|uniref:PP2C family protein-serine/threonine phosphatase n=1 Tax=Daejeonella sp. TaxID=2805397 RepID=UPI003983101F